MVYESGVDINSPSPASSSKAPSPVPASPVLWLDWLDPPEASPASPGLGGDFAGSNGVP